MPRWSNGSFHQATGSNLKAHCFMGLEEWLPIFLWFVSCSAPGWQHSHLPFTRHSHLWHWHVAWPASLWLLIFHLNVWIDGRAPVFLWEPTLRYSQSLERLEVLEPLPLCQIENWSAASLISGRYRSEDPKITWLCVLHFLCKLGQQALWNLLFIKLSLKLKIRSSSKRIVWYTA